MNAWRSEEPFFLCRCVELADPLSPVPCFERGVETGEVRSITDGDLIWEEGPGRGSATLSFLCLFGAGPLSDSSDEAVDRGLFDEGGLAMEAEPLLPAAEVDAVISFMVAFVEDEVEVVIGVTGGKGDCVLGRLDLSTPLP